MARLSALKLELILKYVSDQQRQKTIYPFLRRQTRPTVVTTTVITQVVSPDISSPGGLVFNSINIASNDIHLTNVKGPAWIRVGAVQVLSAYDESSILIFSGTAVRVN